MRYYLYITIFLLCLSCHSKKNLYEQKANLIVLNDSIIGDEKIEGLIQPYRIALDKEMDVVLGTLDTTFEQKRSAAESMLGNWVADVVFESGYTYLLNQNILQNEAVCFSLINKGGLRSSLNKGPITKGEIYELMPFDNEIVVLKLDNIQIRALLKYLFNYQGQPIGNANCQLSSNQNKLFIHSRPYLFDQPIYVITSDYLAKGGDKMYFFDAPITYIQTGILIRDALIQEVKTKKSIHAPLNFGRIQFVK
ncbi:hypothetical protein DNU06_08890 [Putridiphycobacter roseus]|uniref:5'-Nucleotidase C-terminal domain-containing protein n=1 Tax=Putridiphycobacter roseus TaxID=2219161 RepID=A0A2W1MZN3_9FLAO|nr:5'-nucleotidase C-terminal domain-containing protein [Putridiphycobacter roseus]PZE17377.1 hypothetical protein DNU06_08890 [Putridiphycobacter roseus]